MKASIVSAVIAMHLLSSSFATATSLESAAERLAVVQSKGMKLASDSLAIVGRGIALEKTGESIALACTQLEENLCKTLRWVYFSSEREVYAFGQTIELESAQDLASDEVKAAIKMRLKEYKMTERNNRLWNRVTGKSNSAIYLVGGTSVAYALVASNPVGIIVVTGAMLVASAAYMIRGGEFGAFMLTTNTVENHATLDRNGWSWSSLPNSVSKKRLKKMINTITSPIVTIERTRQ